MADQKVNELSTATPALTDYIMGMSGSAEYKALVSAVAKKIVEDYAGSSLAGSNQSIKAALDGLNSKLAVTYLPATADLDTVTNLFSSAASGAIASAIGHSPVTNAFVMITIPKSSNAYTQILSDASKIMIRTKTSSGWGAWYRYNGTVVS